MKINKQKIIWMIIGKKHHVTIEFTTNKLGKWLLNKLMSSKKITMKLTTQDKIKGRKYNSCYIDELI